VSGLADHRSCGCSAFPPDVKCGFPELPLDATSEAVALDGEDVLNSGLDCEEALGKPGRLEALHFTFSPLDRLMRILCPIVFPKTLTMNGR